MRRDCDIDVPPGTTPPGSPEHAPRDREYEALLDCADALRAFVEPDPHTDGYAEVEVGAAALRALAAARAHHTATLDREWDGS